MSQNKLYVGNLSFQLSDTELRDAFSEFGSVIDARIVTDRDTGRSRGFGFVEMETPEQAEAAIEGLHNTQLAGRQIQVNIARPRPNRGGGGPRGGGRRDNRW